MPTREGQVSPDRARRPHRQGEQDLRLRSRRSHRPRRRGRSRARALGRDDHTESSRPGPYLHGLGQLLHGGPYVGRRPYVPDFGPPDRVRRAHLEGEDAQRHLPDLAHRRGRRARRRQLLHAPVGPRRVDPDLRGDRRHVRRGRRRDGADRVLRRQLPLAGRRRPTRSKTRTRPATWRVESKTASWRPSPTCFCPTTTRRARRPASRPPESMVADNDYAVGLVVEALAASPFLGQERRLHSPGRSPGL